MTNFAQKLNELDCWLQAHHYQAYDPFDGLNAWVRPLAIGAAGRIALQQAVRRFPYNLRPILGIRPAESSKGMGYLARGYLKLYQATQDGLYLNKGKNCLDWLVAHASPGYSGLCWGNHFDYQSRVFYLPKGAPTVVWTALIGHAFMDAWEFTGDSRYLEHAGSICRFILNDLERRPAGAGKCISYIPGEYHDVHNASMLAGAFLARMAGHTHESQLSQIASEAMAYTVGAQRPDGSWWYGEADNLHWVDNFHTGYVLDSLWWYLESTQDRSFEAAFENGALYFVKNFFLEDGTPKYYPSQAYPVDIQCASQAIETLLVLSRALDPKYRTLAEKVASWTIGNMQDPDGHFWFQRWPALVNKTPMLHWGQATMFHALSGLV